MAAYIIAIRDKIKDPAALEKYGQEARKAMPQDGKPLAAYGPLEVLEGPPSDGVVLLEFPDAEAAKAWYQSPGYQAASEHRRLGADYRFILFEGI